MIILNFRRLTFASKIPTLVIHKLISSLPSMSAACWFLNYLPVNTLLLILISRSRREDHKFSEIFTCQRFFYSEYRVYGLLKLLKKVEKNLPKRKIAKSAVKREPKRGKIIKDLPDPKPVVFLKEVKKKKKSKNQRQIKEMSLYNPKLGKITQTVSIYTTILYEFHFRNT